MVGRALLTILSEVSIGGKTLCAAAAVLCACVAKPALPTERASVEIVSMSAAELTASGSVDVRFASSHAGQLRVAVGPRVIHRDVAIAGEQTLTIMGSELAVGMNTLHLYVQPEGVIAAAASFVVNRFDDAQTATKSPVGGTVSGLQGSLTLALGAQSVTLTTDGPFSFPTTLEDGTGYDVTLVSQPFCQRCVISGPTGIVGPSASVGVSCSSGVPGPRVVVADLDSGPNTGGEDDLGVFVTLYGEGFGATRGASRVTMGGVEVARYVEWGADQAARKLDRIVVQPGPSVPTGSAPIVVTVDGKSSTPLAFVVRPGRVLFASPSGGDLASGTRADPFSLQRGRNEALAGDTVYMLPGVYGAPSGGTGCDAKIFCVRSSAGVGRNGTAANPIAFIGYPSPAVVQLGDPLDVAPTLNHAVVLDRPFVTMANVTVGSGQFSFVLVSGGATLVGATAAEIVGSPATYGAAVATGQGRILATHLTGKCLVDNGELGWSRVDVTEFLGVRLDNAISIHHNEIIDVASAENGLYEASSGTATGPITTNVIRGLDTGIALYGSGTISVRNNVLRDNGLQIFANPYPGQSQHLTLEDNIFDSNGGSSFTSSGVDGDDIITVHHNAWQNAPPADDTDPVAGIVTFTSVAAGDLSPTPGAPTIDKAAGDGAGVDFTGVERPRGAAADLGAYEYCK